MFPVILPEQARACANEKGLPKNSRVGKAQGTLTPDDSARYTKETAAREHEIALIETMNAREDMILAQAMARADRSDKAQEKLNSATATYNASIEKLTKSIDTLAELNVKAGKSPRKRANFRVICWSCDVT